MGVGVVGALFKADGLGLGVAGLAAGGGGPAVLFGLRRLYVPKSD